VCSILKQNQPVKWRGTLLFVANSASTAVTTSPAVVQSVLKAISVKGSYCVSVGTMMAQQIDLGACGFGRR